MLNRFRQKRDQEVELNLTPIMNLFVAMIPFLLMCASFYTVGVVNASAPVVSSSGDSDLAKGDDKVTLAIEIHTMNGYVLSAQSDTLPEAVVDQLSSELPKKGVNLDTKSLTDHAEWIKTKYPKSDTAMILPQPEVVYSDLIATMDAVREKITGEGDSEVHTLLFPVIVVSSMGGTPAGPAPEGAPPAEGAAPPEGG